MMKQRLYIYITIFLLILTTVSCGFSTILKKADESYGRGEYALAASQYRRAYAKISPKKRDIRGVVAWKMADCYRRINFVSRARGAYINAIRYQYPDSTALLYQAQVELKMGRYNDAKKNFDAYLQLDPTNILAINGRKSCDLLPLWKADPTRYIVKKDKLFNGRRADYSPAYAGEDVTTIYFTSTRNEATGNDINPITDMKSADIFFATVDENGAWKKPELLESEVNSEFEDGACCFTPDGKTMYFTRCITKNNGPAYAEIYSSQRSGASWGVPTVCTLTKDSLSSYAHPAVDPEGRYLYFVSDIPGGYGGLDIWRAEILSNGFGAVENLGEKINTPGTEMFPSFNSKGQLYFSSDGHPGMGGLDIFQATMDSTGNWVVENLKSPVNSQADDFGMTFEPNKQKGFFASNRNDAKGWDHLYTFELPEITYTLTGWVYDKDAYELENAVVNIVGKDGTNVKYNTKRDGSFTCKLDMNTSYVMLASCRGYLNYKQELTTDTVKENKLYELEFPLSSITRPVRIDNIFYEFDKATLTPESTKSLDELIKLLNDNPNVTIELSSHCDYKGADAYNERLSQRRAESVVKYLVEGGIAADRLEAKGYGETKPVVVTKRLAKEHPFLQQDSTLTENYIKKFTEEQQDTCNALNRRTEFKVLKTTYNLYE